jgi:hypothetical protein
MNMAGRAIAAAVIMSLAACSGAPRNDDEHSRLVSPEARATALSRARVWREPEVPIEEADLSKNPPGSFSETDEVRCTFVREPASGTTPKFHCRTRDGVELKVKYGANNPELPAEIAASRLLSALGFPVDHVFRVRSVQCVGCPPDPFGAMQCLARGGTEPACLAGASSDRPSMFAPVTIERPLEGRRIESTPDQGWSWFELDRIDPRAGGATRAEVDALRLMAVVLAHWDNKGPNQRLLCPPGAGLRGGVCAAPLAIVQDLGATFGPLKLDLPNWQRSQVWADARSCIASMKALPYNGGTFGEHAISEQGRQFALRLLRRLTTPQIRDLFTGSGVTALDSIVGAAHEPGAWTRAFLAKIDAIEAAGPCPPGL